MTIVSSTPTRITAERLAELRTFVEWQRPRPDLLGGINVAASLLDELDAVTRERDQNRQAALAVNDMREAAELEIRRLKGDQVVHQIITDLHDYLRSVDAYTHGLPVDGMDKYRQIVRDVLADQEVRK